MHCVIVRHRNSEKNYLFEVPEDLLEHVAAGRICVCDTRFGKQQGVILTDAAEMRPEDIALFYPEATLPLRQLVGVYEYFPLEAIKIPKCFRRTTPRPETIYKRLRELRDTGTFRTHVAVENGVLQDGYSAYLVSKMYDRKLPVLVEAKGGEGKSKRSN